MHPFESVVVIFQLYWLPIAVPGILLTAIGGETIFHLIPSVVFYADADAFSFCATKLMAAV
jgi:hypothetical protein